MISQKHFHRRRGRNVADKQQDYLSKENTVCIKRIFAVVILLHHVMQYNLISIPYYPWLLVQSAGYLSVSVFFFLSGYGLSIQAADREDYLRRFWRHRLLPMYGTYLYVMAWYTAFFFAIGRRLTVEEILRSLVLNPTLVTNGWYFLFLLMLYLLFWLVHIGVKDPMWQTLVISGVLILYCAAGIVLKWGYWTYVSLPAFPAGMLYQRQRSRIEDCMTKRGHYGYSLLFLILLFGVSFLFSHMYRLPEWAYLSCRILSGVLFPLLVVLLVRKLPVCCGLTRFLGKYALYLYAMQGMVMYGLTNVVGLREPTRYTLVSFGLTLLLAMTAQCLERFLKRGLMLLGRAGGKQKN